MRVIAVPVKSLSRTKSRLSAVMDALERGALSLAMLEDVLDATLTLPGWETWVVSPDEAVLEIAAGRGAQPLPEEKPGLGSAVRQVEREAIDRGADALAVLLGDTPMVTETALAEALRTLGSVVVAPARDDGGTNLLLRRPPRAIASRFGRDSFHKHLEAAAARDVPVSLVRRPELAFDLDAPDDILGLLETGTAGRTRSVCLEMNLPERLRLRERA